MNKSPSPKCALLHLLGLALCILPPAFATISYFPLWSEAEGGKIIAGGGVLLLVIFALPIFKWLNRMLRRATPYVFWTVIFVIFFALSKISHEMTVISFAGSLGNILGAICFAIEKRRIRRETGEL